VIDSTHNPRLESWVTSANGHPHFPIQNLPWGVFQPHERAPARVGVAIGDFVLDVSALGECGALNRTIANACQSDSLNALMRLEPSLWSHARAQLSHFLAISHPKAQNFAKEAAKWLTPISQVWLHLPFQIGDYTDFYASRHHAMNVGKLFRPDNPLLPNYDHVPIAYHGRASSITVSGTPIHRPMGQQRPDETAPPIFAPSKRLDYELELGFVIGGQNALGASVPIAQAQERIFGAVLLNDWSARDIQAWEYQPLGPFLAKNFATTISPWVITMDALKPFRCEATTHDTRPLPYLWDEADQMMGGLEVQLEVWLETAHGQTKLSTSQYADMYWTPAQMIAHHTSGGCNLRPGDLIGSGTVSGPTPEARGCLLELTDGGKRPVQLSNGETRAFLEDGDVVVMRGSCRRDGATPIGFGECKAQVLPAYLDKLEQQAKPRTASLNF
jgi:fumarylacetoacetase